MSRDQRVNDNHALIAAQKHALAKNLPLAVVFCLQESVGYRAQEHFTFMLKGLEEVEAKLNALHIPFIVLIGDAYSRISGLVHHTSPDALYFDFSPLNGPKSLLQKIAQSVPCSVYVVDTHNVIPVWITSEKIEVGAYTIRPKIHRQLSSYLVAPEQPVPHPHSWPGIVQPLQALETMISDVVSPIPKNGTNVGFRSGETAAEAALQAFISHRLQRYAVDRNQPDAGAQSELSPYLHFGQLSALRVALELQIRAVALGSDLGFLSSAKMPKPEEAKSTELYGINALIEEIIVRKELSDNFCYYTPAYRTLAAAPAWARASLDKHRADSREFLYSYEQLRDGLTHDPAWNAAQKQMRSTGKMHGYMRMYWAKKVLEWTESPEQAIEHLVQLNDHYSIDGGDPNGYAGILWSVAGVHDRPWAERPVFGVVRYMNYAGLKRKFAIEAYEKQWQTYP